MGSRPAGKTLAGVLILILGLICLAVLVVSLAKDLSIWILGRHVTAEVIDSWYELNEGQEESEFSARYFVAYRFTTPRGRVVDGASEVGGMEWSSLGIGSPVDIVYFPLYPLHNRLDDSRFVLFLALIYAPLVFLAWAGLTAGCHLLRPSPKAHVPFLREILGQNETVVAPS